MAQSKIVIRSKRFWIVFNQWCGQNDWNGLDSSKKWNEWTIEERIKTFFFITMLRDLDKKKSSQFAFTFFVMRFLVCHLKLRIFFLNGYNQTYHLATDVKGFMR